MGMLVVCVKQSYYPPRIPVKFAGFELVALRDDSGGVAFSRQKASGRKLSGWLLFPIWAKFSKRAIPSREEEPMRTMVLIVLLIAFQYSESAVLLELGGGFSRIKKSGNRVLTLGSPVSILWDAESKTPLLRNATSMDLAGDVLLDYAPPLVSVFDARTLALKASFEVSPFHTMGLGRGGNYIWVMYGSEMEVYDLEGRLLWTKKGISSEVGQFLMDSSDAFVHRDGADSIEVLSAKDGTVKAHWFLGDFSAWFEDGTHFVTKQAGFVRIYNRNGVQERFFPMERTYGIGGSRGYFWVQEWDGFWIYSLANPTTPVKSFTWSDMRSYSVDSYGSTLILWPKGNQGKYYAIELGQDSLQVSIASVPSGYEPEAIDGDPEWWVFQRGLLAIWDRDHPETQLQPLFPGNITALAGGPSDVFVAKTVSRTNFIFRRTQDSAIVLKSFQEQVQSIKVSDDGRILAYQHQSDPLNFPQVYQLSLYSIEDGRLLSTWPSPIAGDTVVTDYNLSPDGTLLGVSFVRKTQVANSPRKVKVTRIKDDSLLFEAELPGSLAPAVSPKGDVLVQNGGSAVVYRDGNPIGVAATYPLGWLNDSLYFGSNKDSTFVFHVSGQRIKGMGFPIGATSYSRFSDSVVSLNNQFLYNIKTGARIWAPNGPSAVALVGPDHYVQQIDTELRLLRRDSPVIALHRGNSSRGVGVQVVKGPTRLLFRIEMPRSGYVTVDTWNATGKRLERVFQGRLAAGNHVVAWNPKGKGGARPAGNACFYSVHAGTSAFSGRL
jgi:hypothetical protein